MQASRHCGEASEWQGDAVEFVLSGINDHEHASAVNAPLAPGPVIEGEHAFVEWEDQKAVLVLT